MRHKQRPTKASRHKSVTFIIDSANANAADQSPAKPVVVSSGAIPYKPPAPASKRPLLSSSNSHLAPGPSKSSIEEEPASVEDECGDEPQQEPDRAPIVVASNEHSDDHCAALMRKFEHNYRHMSDVMRLAFLENNDMTLDDCANVDFNSLSTASILQRNIQQQLQQERRDQLQLRQQQQQQQQQQHLLQQHQQQFGHHQQPIQLQDMTIDEDFDQDDYYDDDISDSRIFATATSGSSADQLPLLETLRSSSKLIQHYRQQQQQQQVGANLVMNDTPGTSGTGRTKRSRDTSQQKQPQQQQQVDYLNPAQIDGEGFLCEEPGCGKSFPSLRKLRHHKVVHSDDFPFVCEFNGCNKKFKRKFGIDLHSTTHFDLDPEMYSKTSNNSSLPFFGRRMQYSMCKPCGQKFKTVHDYQYHMLKHGKEPFKCPVKGCGQTFSIWKSFQKHRASHYFNYFCKMDPQCDHHTSNLQLLKLHIYCCHFKRSLPENATLSAKDPPEEDVGRDDTLDVVDNDEEPSSRSEMVEEQAGNESLESGCDEGKLSKSNKRQHILDEQLEQHYSDDEMVVVDKKPKLSVNKSTVSEEPTVHTTPTRWDGRLRKNPPRSRNIEQQQERPDQSQLRPHHQQQHHLLQQHQQQFNYNQQPIQDMTIDEEFDQDDYYDDDISDSKIFATATSGSSADQLPLLDTLRSSSKLIQNYRQQQQEDSGHLAVNDTPGTSGSGRTKRSREINQQKQQRQQMEQQQQEQQQRIDYLTPTRMDGDGFLCGEPGCGKSFPSLRKLRHHKVVHSDDFPFVCEFNGCNKKFKRKFGIDLHSTTHFDLDPEMYSKTSNNSSLPFFGRRMQYSMCKPCGQKFKTVHDYQYHMLKHGKEPFKCPVKGCGQTFSIWKSFQKHRASHYFNYFCKMDPQCDHHTSNLQLLKLHIYCCHFKRSLPENATLSAKDPPEEDVGRDDTLDVVDNDEEPSSRSEMVEEQAGNESLEGGCDEEEWQEEPLEEGELDKNDKDHPEEQQEQDDSEEEMEVQDKKPKIAVNKSAITQEPVANITPMRRDGRLRKNPPRSSAFLSQDYASLSNGSNFLKSISSTPTSTRRSRTSANSTSSSQAACNQSTSAQSERKIKSTPKAKRSAQRLPMSMIATEESASAAEEEGDSDNDESMHNDCDEEDMEQDPSKRNKFKCHLCDYKFSVRFQLTKHLSTHLELTSGMYSATADEQVVQLSERRRREYYCDKCSIKYESMYELDNHMRKHGNKPYVCHFCQTPSVFRTARQYLSHLYEHRFNYKCTMAEDCDFTINRKDALKLHIFRMHLNQQLPAYIENYVSIFDSNESWEQ